RGTHDGARRCSGCVRPAHSIRAVWTARDSTSRLGSERRDVRAHLRDRRKRSDHDADEREREEPAEQLHDRPPVTATSAARETQDNRTLVSRAVDSPPPLGQPSSAKSSTTDRPSARYTGPETTRAVSHGTMSFGDGSAVSIQRCQPLPRL